MTQQDLRVEHDRLYKQASATVYPLIEIHGKPVPKLTAEQERELLHGIQIYDRVIEINPQNWPAMFMVGKAYQRLKDFEKALRWFSRAHEIHPEQPDVAREASIAAMEAGRPAEAIPLCQKAIQSKPNDPGLRANLALAFLFTGDVEKASSVAEEAMRQDANDEITRRIVDVCQEVRAGRRPCPHHARDL